MLVVLSEGLHRKVGGLRGLGELEGVLGERKAGLMRGADVDASVGVGVEWSLEDVGDLE